MFRFGWRRLAAWMTRAVMIAAMAEGAAAEVRAAPEGVLVVAVDPGHGGHDPGAVAGGLVEKDVVLGFARRLEAEIEALPGLDAVLTRTDDSFLPLDARVRSAVAAEAGVLLSVHADSAGGGASGLSVYTMSPFGMAAAGEALVHGQAPDEVLRGAALAGAGDDVTRVLVDLAQRRTAMAADALAAEILAALGPEVKLLRTRPHREANLRVLRAPDIPSLLIELGFLSSAADRKRLTDRHWQVRTARQIAEGIAAWHAGSSIADVQP